MSSLHGSPSYSAGVPDTFEQRVEWALDNKRICLLRDHEDVNAPVPNLDMNYFNREIVESLQEAYEKKHKRKKIKLMREQEEKERKEKEKPRLRLRPRTNEKPNVVFETSKGPLPSYDSMSRKEGTTAKKPAGTSAHIQSNSSKRRARHETDDEYNEEESDIGTSGGPPPKKVARRAIGKGQVGSLRPSPCLTCRSKGRDCYNQPADLEDKPVCLGCKRAKVRCSHVAKKKAEKTIEQVAALSNDNTEDVDGTGAIFIPRSGPVSGKLAENGSLPGPPEVMSDCLEVLDEGNKNILKDIGIRFKMASKNLEILKKLSPGASNVIEDELRFLAKCEREISKYGSKMMADRKRQRRPLAVGGKGKDCRKINCTYMRCRYCASAAECAARY